MLKKSTEPEHHLKFTYKYGKSAGTYLTHRIIPFIGETGLVLAKETFSVLQEFNSVESIQAVLLFRRLDGLTTGSGSFNRLPQITIVFHKPNS